MVFCDADLHGREEGRGAVMVDDRPGMLRLLIATVYPLVVVTCAIMNRPFWFALLVFGLAACGGSSGATTGSPSTTSAAAVPSTAATSAPTTVAAAEGALAGLAFEVHQDPG